jgi:hypothetical protein
LEVRRLDSKWKRLKEKGYIRQELQDLHDKFFAFPEERQKGLSLIGRDKREKK